MLLTRIHICAVIVALAGLLALCAIALQFSFTLVFACLCVITVAGYMLVAMHQRQRRMLEQSGIAVGNFMRGGLHARLDPAAADDAFSRLQHRINNLLDVIDLHLRGSDAAIDLTKHADYAAKLKLTGLSEALQARADGGAQEITTPPAASAPAVGTAVGTFLQELRQQAEGFFAAEQAIHNPAEARSTSYQRELTGLQRHIQQAANRLQQATSQLAQRAMQPAPEPSRGSPKHWEASCARLAEQATVLSLNVAIEAGRAPAFSPLHGATEELRALAKQLQVLRGDLTRQVSPQPEATAVPTVPLSVAVEALTTAEQMLRAQLEMIAEMVARLDPTQPMPMTEAEAA